MAKQSASTVVPRLRFPEFESSSAWEEKHLAKVCERIMDGTHFSPKSKAGPRPYLTSKNIRDGRIDLADLCYISEEEHQEIFKRCPVRKWDVLLTKDGANTGNCALNTLDFEFSLLSSVAVLRGDAARISQEFLFQSIVSDRTRKIIEDSMSGQAITRITLEKLGGYVIPVPGDENEQQKIADCLTSLDEVIAAQGRKVGVLKTHKRGLMQQLFPREGETCPRLRFPEFRNAPEWEKKTGGMLFEHRKEEGEDGLTIYSVTINDGMIPRASFDRDFYDIENPAKNKKACKGDIAYNMMRMWQGAQGVAIEDCMVSPAYVVLSPLEGVCSSFFAHLFKLPQSLELLTAHSRGLTKDRLRLYFDDFARMPLCVPGHEEQQRIADCLYSLDAQIDIESDRLATLKNHKQGLMQQLFPARAAASA